MFKVANRGSRVKANSRKTAEQFSLSQRPFRRGSTEYITAILGSIFPESQPLNSQVHEVQLDVRFQADVSWNHVFGLCALAKEGNAEWHSHRAPSGRSRQ